MADIAICFHWSPADMDVMPLSELLEWQELAVERMKQIRGK
jgi:hypothetical protein